ncbi:MAG: cation-translocating P-type ATPase [Candidatus Woesearchaeota archaeon]
MSNLKEKYWYLRSRKEVLDELKTSLKGLTSTEVNKRLNQDGLNTLAKEEDFRFIKILFRNFKNILILVLFFCMIISFLSGPEHYVEGFVILAIILITGLSGFFQEYHAAKSIDALSKLTAKKVNVLRDNKWCEIDSIDLVKGDIVSLKRGMIVPTDLRILESNGLSVDESILTGESVQKFKHAKRIDKQDLHIAEQNNIVFSGTSVTGGTGIGVVIDVGLETEIGKISKELTTMKERVSPLQKKMHVMGRRISLVVITVCILLFIYLLNNDYDMLLALILVSAVAVSAIPESLPLALTMTLSYGVKKMAKKNAIIKDLNSVETLGTTTVICTDKTGTLTQNKMVVEKIVLADGTIYEVFGKGYEPNAKFKLDGKSINIKKNNKQTQFLLKGAILCNNAELNFQEVDWKLDGEPTEGSILAVAKSSGFDEEVLREDNPRIFEIPFDPEKKYMITVNKDKKNYAYLKGAAEKVIDKCSHFRLKSGKIKKLTKKDKDFFFKLVHKNTNLSYRVLCFATKFLQKWDEKKSNSLLKNGYVFEGLVAIKDPIRQEVYQSIKECNDAGIRVVMITGDHKSTAQSIGCQLGLIRKEHNLIIEGNEIDKLTDDELDELIEKVAIIARSSPEHKLRIVKSLQRKDEIVAMTGDGVNDAPALKRADIGISMGLNGTDVARESSKMVLADDNFSSIVKAVKEGRTIYSNIRRFIFYLLSVNMTELLLITVCILLGLIPPLTVLMILFINLITSVIPSLALSVEPMNPKVIKQRPRNPKERLLSSYIVFKLLSVVPIMFFGTFALFVWEIRANPEATAFAQTLAFATIIMFELMHALNVRSLHSSIFNKNFFSNPYIFLSIAISFSLMMSVIYTSIGQSIFGTVPLPFSYWVIILFISSLVIIVTEIVKLLIKSEMKEQANMNGIRLEIH